jgi:hypothetical protein
MKGRVPVPTDGTMIYYVLIPAFLLAGFQLYDTIVVEDSSKDKQEFDSDVVDAFCRGKGHESGFDSLTLNKITCVDELGPNQTLMTDYSRGELK